jgi:DNA-binding protein YbaB
VRANQTDLRAGLLSVRDKLVGLEVTAESVDGLVEATVDGRGALVALALDERIYRTTDSAALARDILATVRRAAKLAAERAFELTTAELAGVHLTR